MRAIQIMILLMAGVCGDVFATEPSLSKSQACEQSAPSKQAADRCKTFTAPPDKIVACGKSTRNGFLFNFCVMRAKSEGLTVVKIEACGKNTNVPPAYLSCIDVSRNEMLSVAAIENCADSPVSGGRYGDCLDQGLSRSSAIVELIPAIQEESTAGR